VGWLLLRTNKGREEGTKKEKEEGGRKEKII
jgi:hypothetical protein